MFLNTLTVYRSGIPYLQLTTLESYADKRFVSRLTNVVSEKAIAGRARKAARAEQKKEEEAAALEAEEEAKWKQGAKGWTVADERKQNSAKRAEKKKELSQIAAQDQKLLLGSLQPKKFKGRCRTFGNSYKKNCLVDRYIAILIAKDVGQALRSVRSLPAYYWDSKSMQPPLEVRLETEFKEFISREGVAITESYPNLQPRDRELILWDMFQLSSCNPANELLPSALALKEDKIKYLESLRSFV